MEVSSGDDDEPVRDHARDLLARLAGGLAAEEAAAMDRPHVVICRDPETGTASCQGPFVYGFAALVAAHRQAEIERACGSGLEFTAYPLSPVSADPVTSDVWRVTVVLVDVEHVDTLLAMGVAADLEAATTFAGQVAVAAAPYQDGDRVVAFAARGKVRDEGGQPTFVPAPVPVRLAAVLDPTGRFTTWTPEPDGRAVCS